VAIRSYALAPLFVWDHWSRDLPETVGAVSTRVVESPRRMLVELGAIGYDELLSDARHYAFAMADGGYDDRRLIASAKRVVVALEKAGRP
jgi:hypothetical protein